MIDLTRDGDVFTLTMTAGENRWNTTFVREFAQALDEVEASEGPAALVTTSASEKFFSNGLDLDWVAAPEAHPQAGDRGAFGGEFMALMGRIITFPVPTICAINGHAFGAGFMAALCHDVRIMRSDRGFACANEMQLGMKIPDQELALFRHKLPLNVFFETVQLARRWTGPDALAAGIVSEIGELEGLLASAQRRAAQLAPLGANRKLYGGQKETLYGENAVLNGIHGPAYLLRTAGDH
jgi:enoyl-CoA hydratase/carnithine racemase